MIVMTSRNDPAGVAYNSRNGMKLMIRRSIMRWRWPLLFIAGPTVFTTAYYGLIASDEYMSESRFIIKNQSDRSTQMPSIASLIQTTGLSSGQEQTNEILDYIRSRNALQDIGRRIDLRAMYSRPGVDWFSRYAPLFDAWKFENFYQFFREKMEARIDPQTGVAVLDVKAFNPNDSYRINELMLARSEEVVNRFNDKARENAISEAERRVRTAEVRVKAARLAVASYRNGNQIFDPSKQALGVYDIANKLTTEKAMLQAQLDLMLAKTPDNPAIPALKSQISAIQNQISEQNDRVVGPSGAFASKLSTYENLQLEQDFATQALSAASIALEQARTEADRQQFYLERIVEPTAPDVAAYPRRLRGILTVLFVSLCLYVIGWMFVVGILEHAPEE